MNISDGLKLIRIFIIYKMNYFQCIIIQCGTAMKIATELTRI